MSGRQKVWDSVKVMVSKLNLISAMERSFLGVKFQTNLMPNKHLRHQVTRAAFTNNFNTKLNLNNISLTTTFQCCHYSCCNLWPAHCQKFHFQQRFGTTTNDQSTVYFPKSWLLNRDDYRRWPWLRNFWHRSFEFSWKIPQNPGNYSHVLE